MPSAMVLDLGGVFPGRIRLSRSRPATGCWSLEELTHGSSPGLLLCSSWDSPVALNEDSYPLVLKLVRSWVAQEDAGEEASLPDPWILCSRKAPATVDFSPLGVGFSASDCLALGILSLEPTQFLLGFRSPARFQLGFRIGHSSLTGLGQPVRRLEEEMAAVMCFPPVR